MKNNLYDKAYLFAVRVVKVYQFLSNDKKEFILSKQLLRSGTSVGAKISIAYKESLETKYWLNLLKDTAFISEKAFESLFKDADEIAKILFSILKTTRINPNKLK